MIFPLRMCLTPEGQAWLRGFGSDLPEGVPQGCYPSPAELKAVSRALPDVSVEVKWTLDSWMALVDSLKNDNWTSLRVNYFSGDDQIPLEFYFDAGCQPLMHMIVKCLVPSCGPFFLLDDAGNPPEMFE